MHIISCSDSHNGILFLSFFIPYSCSGFFSFHSPFTIHHSPFPHTLHPFPAILIITLFSQNRNIMIISAVCNIILDFIFVQTYGVSGLYFATIICNGLLFARDNYAVYHYGFHKSIFGYYALLGKWSIGIVISTILSYLIKAIITVHGFWGIILKWVLISAAYFVCVLLTNIKNDEFKFFVWLIKVRIIKRYCK